MQARDNRDIFIESLSTILSGPHISFRVSFDYSQSPGSSVIAKSASAVTEIVLHYFQPPVSKSQQGKVTADAAAVSKGLHEEVPAMESFASGWQIEGDDEVEYDKIEGGKARMFVKLLGWPSIEAHMVARETRTF